jgi:uncharacterized repeat protein (TIGR03847 family)
MSTEGEEPDHKDLGSCSVLDAESVGPPGQRYFRLRVVAEEGAALIWLEKEQLQQLGIAIKQMLKTEMAEAVDEAPSGDAGFSDYEFKVSRLALGQDRDKQKYAILADGNVDDDRTVALVFWSDHQQIDRLADRALAVCAGGRPTCPLCSGPLNEGEEHVCVRTNGHMHHD